MEIIDYAQKPGQILSEKNIKDLVNPLISVITINDAKEINTQETIFSVLNQSLKNWEWIIVDITDNQEDISITLDKFQSMDSRIKIYKKTNLGIADAKQYAIEKTNSDYICFLEFGDLLDKTFFECAYWTLITNTEATWAYSNHIVFGDKEYVVNKKGFTEEDLLHMCAVVKKEKIIGFNKSSIENNIFNQDSNLWLKLLKDGYYPVKMNYYGFWNKSINRQLENIDDIKKEFNQLISNIKVIEYPVSCNYYYELPKKQNYSKDIKYNSKKKNLLFIFPWLRVGGADKFNLDLISKLDKDKYNITILTTEDCYYEWRQKFELYATIFDLTSFLNRENWTSFISYIIETRNIDITMISNSYYAYYTIPWLKSQFPKVVFLDYLHAVNYDWRNGEYPSDSVAISKLLDMTYVSSEYIKKFMSDERNRTTNNVKIAHVGVDINKFKEDKIDLKNYPQIIEYENKYKNKKIILFCARISKEKRPIFMLQILEKLLEKRKDILLFVVGDGELLEEMKKYVSENNLGEYVIFFGKQEDVRPFYKLSDILVVCSEREGITLTTYEALSMGVPVVSADVGGQYELVDDACGKLIKIEESNIEKERLKYIEAIEQIIYSSDYNMIKTICREKIKEKFSIEVMVKFFEEEFEYFINNGTNVLDCFTDNEELYAQYLLLYNELDRRYYNVPEVNVIDEKQEKIKELSKEIQKLSDENEEIRRLFEKKIENLINENKTIITNKEEIIAKKNQELEGIYNSKSWKYINKVIKIINKCKGK